MMRFATFAVVLFAVVLSLAPVNVDAQTRPELEAFNNLSRAVRAAQSNPSPQRLADMRRSVERAYSEFQTQEKRRRNTGELHTEDGSAGDAAEAASRATALHWRYLYAVADTMIEAANGLEGLAPRIIGFDKAMVQRLGSAQLAALRNQRRVLQAASACETNYCRGTEGTLADFDQSLQGLVNAVVAVVWRTR